jgi:UPF0042 nucleotide-binding protein
MKLTIISGLSGSGKSVALSTLEDLDYYCIDNLPVGMLKAISTQMASTWGDAHKKVAVGIDARNSSRELEEFPDLLKELKSKGCDCTIFFLQADENTLLKRFSETRRKHPLTHDKTSLADAIHLESELLKPIAANADLFIDTTHTTIYQLRDLVKNRVNIDKKETMSLLFQSFGFKNGIPSDADFVFDARCLPNPHWEQGLRPLTGLDSEVQTYLEQQKSVGKMLDDLKQFLDTWLPQFESESRSYMTVAIGCTGGQHRSVFLAENLGRHYSYKRENVIIRHRDLP